MTSFLMKPRQEILPKHTPDFKNELSEIELTLNSIGAEVVFTPNAHCELAGNGVECAWGVSKVFF